MAILMKKMAPAARLAGAALLVSAVCASVVGVEDARAEYGDVVINNYSDQSGMRPVVFPHWFHRIRFRCKVCHADLGFKFKAGGNEINMVKVIDGQFCGACHNGEVAWSIGRLDTSLVLRMSQVDRFRSNSLWLRVSRSFSN